MSIFDRLRPIHYHFEQAPDVESAPPARPSDDFLIGQLHDNITNHPPRDQEVVGRLETVAALAKMYGAAVILNCPDSRERSLAVTKLEESIMWARAGIARHQDDIPLPAAPEVDECCGLYFDDERNDRCDDCPLDCVDIDDHAAPAVEPEPDVPAIDPDSRFMLVPNAATDEQIQAAFEALGGVAP